MSERAIFIEALAQDDPAARSAFLDQACRGDAQLRRRIEELLALHQAAGSFLESPPAPLRGEAREPGATVRAEAAGSGTEPYPSGAPTSAEAAADHEAALDWLVPCDKPGVLGMLGPYEITEVIGRGGMGIVLKGFDSRLHRFVAVKVLAPEMASNPMARRRFLREAQAAAAISHDHVVTIHAVDESDRLPYLVMEYVNGASLQEMIHHKGGLELREILRIGMQVASGLAAAHAQGLVHRDIKPANILLENGVQRVKITDFGLARAVDEVGMTQTGVVTGTPLYMSPEQARGEPIDHRTDLFSLGSVLYAMCCGRSPFRAETAMGVLHRVCDDTPRPIPEINPDIPDWLCAIIDRLLEKDPKDRFQTASEVADLLGRSLAHVQQPTPAALPQSSGGPWGNRRGDPRRPARSPRGELLLGAALLGVIAMLVMLVGARFFTGEPWEIGFGFLQPKGTLILDVNDPEITEILLQPRDERARTHLDGIWALNFQVNEARQLRLPNALAPGLYHVYFRREGPALYEDQAVEIRAGATHRVPVPLSGDVADLLNAADAGGTGPLFPVATRESRTLIGHQAPCYAIALSPDGRLAVSASADETVRVWNLQTGREIQRFEGHRLDEDRKRSKGAWGAVCAAFLPDGRRVVSGGWDGVARLWDIETGEEIRRFEGHDPYVSALAVTPDGRYLATANAIWDRRPAENVIRLWDLATGEEIRRFEGHTFGITSIAIAPDGRHLLSGSADKTVRLWDLGSGQELQRFAHATSIQDVAFAPDGRTLIAGASASTVVDGTMDDPEHAVIRMWEVETGRALRTFRGHAGSVHSVAFSPDGRLIVSGSGHEHTDRGLVPSGDNTIRIWDRETEQELVRFDAGRTVHGARFALDGRTVLSAGEERALRLWEVPESVVSRAASSERVPEIALADRLFIGGPQGSIHGIAIADDGRRALTGHHGGAVCLWDLESASLMRVLTGHDQTVQAVRFTPDGQYAVSGAEDATIRMWDLETGAEVRQFVGHEARVETLDISPDGRWLLSGETDYSRQRPGTLRLWDIATGEEVRAFAGQLGWITEARFLPDGDRVVAIDQQSHGIVLWDVETGQPVDRNRSSLPTSPRCLDVSPDGRYAVTGHSAREQKDELWYDPENCVLRLWDLRTLQEVRQFRGHTGPVLDVCFSPDGKYVLSASSGQHDGQPKFVEAADQTVRLWEVETGREVCCYSSSERIYSVAFLPDGQSFLSGGLTMLRAWEVPEPIASNAELRAEADSFEEVRRFEGGHSQPVLDVVVSPDGRYLLSSSYDGIARVWEIETGREVQTLWANVGAQIKQIAVSPDGRLAATGDDRGKLIVWDLQTGRELRRLEGHTGDIGAVRFSPDGRLIASGTADWNPRDESAPDNSVRLWEVETGRELRRLVGITEPIDALAFAPDGRWVLVAAASQTLGLWEVATGEPLRRFWFAEGGAASVAFAPDGRLAASGHQHSGPRSFRDGKWFNPDESVVRLWNVETGDLVRELRGHSAPVHSVAFAPDGRTLLSASGGHFHQYDPPYSQAFDNSLRLWDVGTGQELARVDTGARIKGAAFTPDGRFVVSGGGELAPFGGDDRPDVRLWKVPEGLIPAPEAAPPVLTEVRRFEGSHVRPVTCVAVSPDGQWLLSGSFDGTLRLWDLATGREIRGFLGDGRSSVDAVAFSPDGLFAASGGSAGRAVLWNVQTGQEVRRFEGHTGDVRAIAFSPDGRTVATGSARRRGETRDHSVRLWDVESGRELRQLEGIGHLVDSLAWSPDGRRLLVGGAGRMLGLWDAATGELVRMFATGRGDIRSVAFSPHGRWVLSGQFVLDPHSLTDGKFLDPDNCIACLWDVESGGLVRILRGHTGPINSVAFSPDGRFILTGSGGAFHSQGYSQAFDNSLRLWDAETGEELWRADTGRRITAAAFTPDGRFVVSGGGELEGHGGDNQPDLRLWRLPEHVVAEKEPSEFPERTAGRP